MLLNNSFITVRFYAMSKSSLNNIKIKRMCNLIKNESEILQQTVAIFNNFWSCCFRIFFPCIYRRWFGLMMKKKQKKNNRTLHRVEFYGIVNSFKIRKTLSYDALWKICACMCVFTLYVRRNTSKHMSIKFHAFMIAGSKKIPIFWTWVRSYICVDGKS